MTTVDAVKTAFDRCQPISTHSLEDFLGTLLDEDLDFLAGMPGTPGQVLASQFTHYARCSVTLRDSIRRPTEQSKRLVDSVLRIQAANKNAH